MMFFPLPTRIGPNATTFVSVSCLVALALGSLAGIPIMMNTGSESEIIKSLAIVFDPLLFQCFALIHCTICLSLWCWEENKKSQGRIMAVIISIFTFGVLFLLYYLVNDLLFKSAFNRPRPDIGLRNNVGIISHLSNFATKGGAPSGFASRAALLLEIAVLSSTGISKEFSGIWKIFSKPSIVFVIQFVLLILVCVFRVLTGFHFWFDIMLGLSLGTFLLWTIILLATAIIDRQSLHHAGSTGTIVVSIILGFIIIGFFYSREASLWSIYILFLMVIITFIQLRANRPEAIIDISKGK